MDREQLVAGLVAGDQEAWRHFVREFGRLIYAIGGKLGVSEADREDIFQNACLAAVRHVHKLRDPYKLSSWVYGITLRLALDLKRRSTPEVSIDGAADFDLLLTSAEQGPLPWERLEDLEQAAQLHDALARLDPRCRHLLSALYLAEPQLNYREISELEGIAMGSIGPTRARCLEKLRRRLEHVSKSTPSTTTGLRGSSSGRTSRDG